MTRQREIHLGYVFDERPVAVEDMAAYSVPPRGSRVYEVYQGPGIIQWAYALAPDGSRWEYTGFLGCWEATGHINGMPPCQAFTPLGEDSRT